MAHLVVLPSGADCEPRPGTVFRLTAVRTVIGRDPASARGADGFLLLPHHAVSRAHAAVELTEAGYVACDLMSRSGIYVNDRHFDHLRPALLADGDRIRICGFVLEFREADPPEVTPPPSSAPPTPRA